MNVVFSNFLIGWLSKLVKLTCIVSEAFVNKYCSQTFNFTNNADMLAFDVGAGADLTRNDCV